VSIRAICDQIAGITLILLHRYLLQKAQDLPPDRDHIIGLIPPGTGQVYINGLAHFTWTGLHHRDPICQENCFRHAVGHKENSLFRLTLGS